MTEREPEAGVPPPARDPGPSGPPRRFLVQTALWTTVAVALTGPLAWWWGDWTWALGIALGALIGLLNLLLLGRAVSIMVRDHQAHRPGRPGDRVFPAVLLLKWPVVLLALAGVLWYMPARPEGVALGVLLSLIGAAAAARQGTGRN